VRRNVTHHHETVRTNFDVVADSDRSQKSRPGADQHVIADGGMSFPDVLAGTTQRDVVKHDTIDTDPGRLADYDTGSVVAEIPFADLCPGMDFKSGQETADLRKHARQERNSKIPEKVDEAMHGNRLKPGVKQELEVPAGRVVAIDGFDIFYSG